MKLSIITINLNNVNGLRKTIESVVNQTFTDYEYIIIDGGSTDGSVEVIKEFADKITYWVSEPDKGIYNAMNKGILKAHGVYLQFLNSGDWFINEDILTSFSLKERGEDIIYGNVNFILSNGEIKELIMPEEPKLTLAFFLQKTIIHQAAFIRKELFQYYLYDENFIIFSDWKFFIQKIILENCKIKYINKTVVNYDTEGISSDPQALKKYMYEKNEILSQLVSARILDDYKIILSVRDSLLLPHIQFLNKTRRFQEVVAGLIGILIRIYKCFRFKKFKSEIK
jgi:glycosyltransferase involved in cell wall biosynthesis